MLPTAFLSSVTCVHSNADSDIYVKKACSYERFELVETDQNSRQYSLG